MKDYDDHEGAKEEFKAALTEARLAMCRALNVGPAVFSLTENWNTFNGAAHRILMSIDKAKAAVK